MKSFTNQDFVYHYPQALRSEAEQVAVITEDVASVLLDKYGVDLPRPMDIQVSNALYSNGQANSVLNQMRLWVTDWDIRLRTTHPWILDVSTHEFTHLATIGLTPKLPGNIYGLQAFYQGFYNDPTQARFQWLLPFRFHTAWFSEGIAQYESSLKGFDTWDTHRDMIMRQATLNDRVLPLVKMDHFDSERELELETGPYTQGFNLVRFIAKRYGDSALVKIWQAHGEWENWSLESCLESVIGIDSDSLFQLWKQDLDSTYQAQMSVLGQTVEGKKLSYGSFNNYQFLSVGDSLYWLSNLQSGAWRENLVRTSDSTLAQIVDSTSWVDLEDIKWSIPMEKVLLSRGWSLDSLGRLLAVSYEHRDDADRAQLDIVLQDDEDQYFLTMAENAFSPRVDKNQQLFYVRRWPFQTKFELVAGLTISDSLLQSISELAEVSDKRDIRRFYQNLAKSNQVIFNDSIYSAHSKVRSRQFNIYNFDISPSGDILVDMYDGWNRQLALLRRAESGGFSVDFLKVEGTDLRHPRWTSDSTFVYSWNLNGVFNIYSYDLQGQKAHPQTHVSGGAFHPEMIGQTLYYSHYDRDGFSLFSIDSASRSSLPQVLPSIMTLRQPSDFIPPEERDFIGSEEDYANLKLKTIINPMVLFEQRANDGLNLSSSRELATKVGANFQWVDPLIRHSLYLTFLTEFNQGVPVLDPKVQSDFFLRYDNWMMDVPVFGDFNSRSIQVSTAYESDDGVPQQSEAGISLSNMRLGAGKSIFRHGDTLSAYLKADYGVQEIERVPSWVFTKSAAIGVEFGQKGHVRNGPMMTPGFQYRIRNEYKWTDFQDDVVFDFEEGQMNVSYDQWETNETAVEALYVTKIPWVKKLLPKWNFSVKTQFQHLERISSTAFVDTTEAWLQPALWIDGYPFLSDPVDFSQPVLFRGDNALLWEAHLQHPLWENGFSWRGVHHRGAWLDWSYQAGQAWDGSIFKRRIWQEFDYARSMGLELRLSQKVFHSMPLELYFKASKALDEVIGVEDLSGRITWMQDIPSSVRPTTIYYGVTFQFLNPVLYQQAEGGHAH